MTNTFYFSCSPRAARELAEAVLLLVRNRFDVVVDASPAGLFRVRFDGSVRVSGPTDERVAVYNLLSGLVDLYT